MCHDMVKFGAIQEVTIQLILSCSQLVGLMNDDATGNKLEKAYQCLGVVAALFRLLELSPIDAMRRKLVMNRIKYDVAECKNAQKPYNRIIPKYTSLDITRRPTGDAEVPIRGMASGLERDGSTAGEDLEKAMNKEIEEFARERGWLELYSNKHLRLSLFAEVGEICSEIEWVDSNKEVEANEEDLIAREVADVGIYLCHIIRLNRA